MHGQQNIKKNQTVNSQRQIICCKNFSFDSTSVVLEFFVVVNCIVLTVQRDML